ncbi:MAG: sigma-70 family RNA polymerase sigma factor [Candidatus Obscuribacterales bacterium]|nr:sigma-70 family RNA polymerase sigma factor [Candidatus Obscuribacterales bacterium]
MKPEVETKTMLNMNECTSGLERNFHLTESATDLELIEACQGGDKRAFDTLFKRYENYIHAHLNKLAPDMRMMHDDWYQEACLRVFRSIGGLHNPRAFKKYLNQIINNLFWDELRKTRGMSFISLDEVDEESGRACEIPDYSRMPEDKVERQEMESLVADVVESLPTQFRNVFKLREISGLPYLEIAAITKTGVGTVKSRIARARARIQDRLEEMEVA